MSAQPMPDLIRCWMSAYGLPEPVERSCQVFGWPNRTTDGAQMFENTHFLDLDKAWKRHLREHEAGVELSAGRVTHLRAQLADAERACADAAIYFSAAKEAYEIYVRSKHGGAK